MYTADTEEVWGNDDPWSKSHVLLNFIQPVNEIKYLVFLKWISKSGFSTYKNINL